MRSGRRGVAAIGAALVLQVVLAGPPGLAEELARAAPVHPPAASGTLTATPEVRAAATVAAPGDSVGSAEPSPGSPSVNPPGAPGWEWVPSFSFVLILAATGVLFFAAARARRRRRR